MFLIVAKQILFEKKSFKKLKCYFGKLLFPFMSEKQCFLKKKMILIRYFPVLFVSGEALREYYFPVFAPLGIIGNLLSLLVNISSHRKKIYFNFIECS